MDDTAMRAKPSDHSSERASRSMCPHRKQIRKAELFAYSCVLDAFRAQGDIDMEKTAALDALGKRFNISRYRRQQEYSRAFKDKFLARVAELRKKELQAQANQLNELFSDSSIPEFFPNGNDMDPDEVPRQLTDREFEEALANVCVSLPPNDLEYHFNDGDGEEGFEEELKDIEAGRCDASRSPTSVELPRSETSKPSILPFEEDEDLSLPELVPGVDIKSNNHMVQTIPPSFQQITTKTSILHSPTSPSPTSPSLLFDPLNSGGTTTTTAIRSRSRSRSHHRQSHSNECVSPSPDSPNGRLSPLSPDASQGSANPHIANAGCQNPIDSIDDFALDPEFL